MTRSFETELVPLLRAVLDRIIPADEDPGALDLGTDVYVLNQLAAGAAGHADAVAEGLRKLDAGAHRQFSSGFLGLDPEHEDRLLAEHEHESWFVVLTELAAEGFYADPANGGNRDAASWAMIGYEPRLPDGPSGRIPTGAGLGAGRVDEVREP
jgi:hypothetical protein